MDKVAFLFSGQGAQFPGMGLSLYNTHPAAKQVFDLAEEMRPGTREQCFYGSKDMLSLTVNTQPCLFTASLAAANSLVSAGVEPAMAAGFSLGEVTALSFAKAFSPIDAFRLVCRRAEFMQSAAEKTNGGMVAVLKLSNAKVEEICVDFENIYPVNYNCPGQLVVAGANDRLSEFCTAISQNGGRAIPLAVSGAFHSPFMDSAAAALAEELSVYTPSIPTIPVYSNLTGEPYTDDIKELLVGQINHPVLWQKTIENMIMAGVTVFIEVGAGKTLCGLVKKINRSVTALAVEDDDSLQVAVRLYGKGASAC